MLGDSAPRPGASPDDKARGFGYMGSMAMPALQPEPAPHAPIEVCAPLTQGAPVIFSSPHSGRAYDTDFLTASQLDPLTWFFPQLLQTK